MTAAVDANGVPIALNYDLSYGVQPHAYFQITLTNEPQTLQALIGGAVPSWAQLAMIVPENGAIRYRCDGTPPTEGVGMPILTDQAWPVQGQASIAALQMIAQTGDATLVSLELRG